MAYQGLSQYDFVQQVYYQETKTVLDFWPTDDKYQEVIFEANMALRDLQKEEDWHWLRNTVCLGETDRDTRFVSWPTDTHARPATLYGDAISLYKWDHNGPQDGNFLDDPDWNFMDHIYRHPVFVPIMSGGKGTHPQNRQHNLIMYVDTPDRQLGVMLRGGMLEFTRPLAFHEGHRLIVADCIMELQPIKTLAELDDGVTPDLFIYDPSKPGDEYHQEMLFKAKHDQILTQMPDPAWMIIQTAYRHAEGEPIFGGRIASLQDQAMKLMSSMREQNAAATYPDYMDWQVQTYINVV